MNTHVAVRCHVQPSRVRGRAQRTTQQAVRSHPPHVLYKSSHTTQRALPLARASLCMRRATSYEPDDICRFGGTWRYAIQSEGVLGSKPIEFIL